MTGLRILVVDDDDETRELVGRALERDGHRVSAAKGPAAALAHVASQPVDLFVLDVMLDGESGLDLCARLRRDGVDAPILFLSARGAVRARIEGLDVGGDDYLAKPFALRELSARVRALGRRGPSVRAPALRLGDVELDFDARRATAAGAEIPVTQREWDVLRALADGKGRVVSFDELLERVWGEVTDSGRASLEVIVSRLRKKLDGAAGQPIIRTARGLGYGIGG